MSSADQVRDKYAVLGPLLNERQCRLWAAAEARPIGRGGVTLVSAATGVSRKWIQAGLQELAAREATVPALLAALEALVAPATRGDPRSPLRWTSKSTLKLAEELTAQGYPVSARTVASMLKELDYSLQGMKKTTEGRQHPDRDAQFQYLNQKSTGFQQRGQPVISVDTKKKELVGDFHNRGRELQPAGQPEPARRHDFPDKELGKVIPHGV